MIGAMMSFGTVDNKLLEDVLQQTKFGCHVNHYVSLASDINRSYEKGHSGGSIQDSIFLF